MKTIIYKKLKKLNNYKFHHKKKINKFNKRI